MMLLYTYANNVNFHLVPSDKQSLRLFRDNVIGNMQSQSKKGKISNSKQMT